MMKKTAKFLLLGLLINSFCSCTQRSIDEVIEKYNKTNFDSMKNTSIYRRSGGNPAIYFVSDYNSECSPYIVEINDRDKSIVKIDNKLVIRSCGTDYLDDKRIRTIVANYFTYDLALINVDNEGNVYINPNEAESPVLLRKVKNSNPKYMNSFKPYKGAWYVKK